MRELVARCHRGSRSSFEQLRAKACINPYRRLMPTLLGSGVGMSSRRPNGDTETTTDQGESMKLYENHQKARRKKKEVEFCIKCEHNNQGFCAKFKMFASSARKYCLEQVQASSKAMKAVLENINKAVEKKKEKIRKEVMSKK